MPNLKRANLQVQVDSFAQTLTLGAALAEIRACYGNYDLLEHFQQGEFHHDIVVRVRDELTYVVATNCNGGVKEVLALEAAPTASALWHWRCPASPEFAGELPKLHALATTSHYFDPCELLRADARSELLPEHRERQPGGGWRPKGTCAK